MKRFLLLTFSLLSLCVAAQGQHKLFYTEGWDSCAAAEAFYRIDVDDTGGMYKIAEYYTRGGKLLTGYMTKIDKDLWSYRTGHFVYYHPSGLVASQGNFSNGRRQGKWLYYAPHSTKLTREVVWDNGEMVKMLVYDTTGNKISTVTSYSQNVEYKSVEYGDNDSTVKLYTYAGKKIVKTTDIAGRDTTIQEYGGDEEHPWQRKTKNRVVVFLQENGEVTEYYDNGKVWKKGTAKKSGEVKYYQCYGVDGKDTSCKAAEGTYSFVERMPMPKFNAMSYLSENVHYPEYARNLNVEGRVMVQFVVFEDGSIGDVLIRKSVHPALDEEAARVIARMPDWVPGSQNGKNVKVYYTQPITFRLN